MNVLQRIIDGCDRAPQNCVDTTIMHYYTLDSDNAICGPFTAPQLVEMLKTNAITHSTPAAAEGDESWSALNDLLPALDEEFRREVHAVLETGPATSPLMMKLLKEDGDFPHPLKPRRPPAATPVKPPAYSKPTAVKTGP